MKKFEIFYVLAFLLLRVAPSWAALPNINVEYDVNVFVKTVLKDIEKRTQGDVDSNVAKYTNSGFINFLKNGKMPDDLKEKIHSYARLFTRAQIVGDTATIKDKVINKSLPEIMAQIRELYYEWAIIAEKERIKLEKELKIKDEALKKAQAVFDKTKKEYEQVLRNLRAGKKFGSSK